MKKIMLKRNTANIGTIKQGFNWFKVTVIALSCQFIISSYIIAFNNSACVIGMLIAGFSISVEILGICTWYGCITYDN